MPYKSIRTVMSRAIRFKEPISAKKVRTTRGVKKSRATKMFLLLTLSAMIPPTGVRRMEGMMAHAVTVP